MILEGVDLSYANARTNKWPDFFIVKATEDTAKDPRWDQHTAKVRRAKKPLAAYHFLRRPGDVTARDKHGKPIAFAHSIAEQIAAFLLVAGDVDGYALDWEGHPPSRGQTREAVALVQQAGKRCGFYASESVFFDAGQDWDWIAHYETSHWPHGADIWQYQGSPLDRDRFEGTQADLVALWSSTGGSNVPGLDLTWPQGPIVIGSLAIPTGTDAIRISNGKHHTTTADATRPAAVKQIAPAGTLGYDVDLVGDAGTDVSHFIRRTEAGLVFTPAVADGD